MRHKGLAKKFLEVSGVPISRCLGLFSFWNLNGWPFCAALDYVLPVIAFRLKLLPHFGIRLLYICGCYTTVLLLHHRIYGEPATARIALELWRHGYIGPALRTIRAQTRLATLRAPLHISSGLEVVEVMAAEFTDSYPTGHSLRYLVKFRHGRPQQL